MEKMPSAYEYPDYFAPYVNLVPQGDRIQILRDQMKETVSLLSTITDSESEYRYAEGKWSVKEVIGHLIDTERVMSYRALCIARGEKVSLPGYDEKEYGANADFDKQSLKDLLDHFACVRQSTIHLVKSLSEESLSRRGIANNSEITPRALISVIAGHELHHRNIVQERYLNL
ncbi:DinB family protein [Fictibacillus phosphorivorans]|uniref:DinB family protein n=1 Tax=Fictibacillus phosphorivorans TaxID=1221500 RepID=UPI00203E0EDB|nr:DinB family protein [Fictibacillus phosphorivorans]MCM3717545.1 DinB family protein [Fictibacillus phosphorivorans]MCM3775240.1 DinB family protein [Fictibacillus phosphorivorans]